LRVRRGAGFLRAVRREFGWFWAAYAVGAAGTWLALDAFALIAILALEAGPGQVSLLAAAGLAVGAAVAVPLGAWVEVRRKRAVMIGMDLVRFAAVISVPIAYALGRLSYAQLLLVAVVVAGADNAFRAAAGACLKSLVGPRELLSANRRLEATTWTATALGPPLGGLAIGLLGPVTTAAANAVSYVLSAAALRRIGPEPRRPRAATRRPGTAGAAPDRADVPIAAHDRLDLLAGWRHILGHPTLRPLLLNTALVNGLIMATAPLLAVLMLGPLGFAPWQYGLAFGAPCVGGLLGARLTGPLVARYGAGRVMRTAGTLRACWSLGLALVVPGAPGLALVLAVQFGLVTCIAVINPLFVTHRLAETPTDHVARTLSAWAVTTSATVAALTAVWGVLATLVGPRAAIAVAGLLLLATPAALPRVSG
jgi:hypothetical protein